MLLAGIDGQLAVFAGIDKDAPEVAVGAAFGGPVPTVQAVAFEVLEVNRLLVHM